MGQGRGPIRKGEGMAEVPSIKRNIELEEDIRDSITTVDSNIMRRDSRPPKQPSAKRSVQEVGSPLVKKIDYPLLHEERASEASEGAQNIRSTKFDLALRMTPIRMDNDLLFRNDMDASMADKRVRWMGRREEGGQ